MTVVTASRPTGSLGKHAVEDLQRIFRTRAAVYRACYEKELASAPDLAGTIVFFVTIARDGSVAEVRLEHNTTPEELRPTGNCIAERMLDLKFPATGKAVFSYPMSFSTQL